MTRQGWHGEQLLLFVCTRVRLHPHTHTASRQTQTPPSRLPPVSLPLKSANRRGRLWCSVQAESPLGLSPWEKWGIGHVKTQVNIALWRGRSELLEWGVTLLTPGIRGCGIMWTEITVTDLSQTAFNYFLTWASVAVKGRGEQLLRAAAASARAVANQGNAT